MITQTWALLLDAYRELNAKKLFWITLILSFLVVAVYAAFGINEQGLTFLWFEFPTPINSTIIPPKLLYKFSFAYVGVPIWLTWIATILALISTASIIPDFIAGGAVELTLSKPIGRVRLLLTKYFTGLLFAALQVLAFSAACLLVIGIRGGSWEWRVLLAVPIVIVFFSYLFCVATFFGLITRSTIASLLLTLLAWVGFFAFNLADELFLSFREAQQLQVEIYERREQIQLAAADTERQRLIADGQDAPDDPESLNPFLSSTRKNLAERRESRDTMYAWSRRIIAVKTVLPKTSETIDLLGRSLLSMDELDRFLPSDQHELVDVDAFIESKAQGARPVVVTMEDPAVNRRVEQLKRTRGPGWLIGTSLGFEAVVLALACVVFTRRDF